MKEKQVTQGLLVIAPIGDPGTWQEAKYLIEGFTYTTNCSSVALVLHYSKNYSKKYSSITLFIQTLDSMVCSGILGDGGNLKKNENLKDNLEKDRRGIAQKLKDLFKEKLVKAANDMGISSKQDGDLLVINGVNIRIHVAVSPSAGEYTIIRPNSEITTIFFNGDPTAVFAKIFNTASLLIEESGSVPHICLDLTHGVNYMQAMAVYAVEMLNSLYETEVQIVNFSPFPRRPPASQKNLTGTNPSGVSKGELPTLVEFDVSSLVQISKLASSISNLILDEADIKTIRKTINQIAGGNENFSKLSRHVSLAWYYLSIGLVTFAYYHLLKADELSNEVKKDYLKDEEVKFSMTSNGNKIKVEYDSSYDWFSAVPLIVWAMYNRLASLLKPGKGTSFKNIKEAIGEIAKKKPVYRSLQDVLDAEFSNIISRYKKIKERSEIKSAWKFIYNQRKFSMKEPALRTIFLRLSPSEIENILGPLVAGKERMLVNIKEILERSKKLLPPLSERDEQHKKRNLISHAGITYEPLKTIIIDENDKFKIDEEWVYNAELELDPDKLGDDPFNVWPEAKASEVKDKIIVPGDRITLK